MVSKQGGAREGAGRKPESPDGAVAGEVVRIRLTKAQHAKLAGLGGTPWLKRKLNSVQTELAPDAFYKFEDRIHEYYPEKATVGGVLGAYWTRFTYAEGICVWDGRVFAPLGETALQIANRFGV